MTGFQDTLNSDGVAGQHDWMTACPACGKEVSRAANACPGCGHPLQRAATSAAPAASSRSQVSHTWHPGVAAVLSLIIPGAGQMYRGNIGTGILWLIFVAIGYFALMVPGLILHLICIVSAATE